MVPQAIKSLLQRSANRFGYHIDKVVERAVVPPIDVFDLLLTRVASETPDFFFVQVGANDGVTDDPIRRYIHRYHWRGLLIEPLPDVFQKLLKNYRDENQLVFENAAVADADGMAKFYVADEGVLGKENLSVFSSLRSDAVERALNWRDMPASGNAIRAIDVRARSVRSLIDQHEISRIDLLQSDAQGYDCEVIGQFLDCGVMPRVIHFEHIHTKAEDLRECYERLAQCGYVFSEMQNDTVASLRPSSDPVH